LKNPDGPRFFLLTGEPGCGKSAIAARLVQFAQGEVAPPDGLSHFAPGFLKASYFCSARESLSIDPLTFARSLSLQLAHLPDFAQGLAQALKDMGDREINLEANQEVDVHGEMTGINTKLQSKGN